MKKFLCFGIGAISLLTINNALANDLKLFVGANVALNTISWSEDLDKETKNIGMTLPDSFFGLGGEIGARLKNNNIYNPGITLAYDYAFDSGADIIFPSSQVFDSMEIGFSAISATFDNYIRFSGNGSKRSDFVFGIGFGNATERVSVDVTPYGRTAGLMDVKEKDHGNFFILKAGFNFEISNNIDFYTNGRCFIPTKSDGDVDALFNLNAGLRYVF